MKCIYIDNDYQLVVLASKKKRSVKEFMFLMENDLGTSMDIQRKHPELFLVMKRIMKNYSKLRPTIKLINDDLKTLKKVSPKY